MRESAKPIIVVGVDGSKPSIEALRWAARQAELTGSDLHVITAWTYPNEPTPFGIVPDVPAHPDQLSEVRTKLQEVVGQALPPSMDVDVDTEVTAGHPASVLVDASRGANLLVVGNRGRGVVAEMLLGSVSEYCVRRASCPVVVVRSGRGS